MPLVSNQGDSTSEGVSVDVAAGSSDLTERVSDSAGEVTVKTSDSTDKVSN